MALNPYTPPSIDQEASPPALVVTAGERMFLVQWCFVLLANIIVPMLFCAMLTNDDARLGVLVAVICFILAGGLVGLQWNQTQVVLLRGGVITALLQMVPVLQIIAGLVAVQVCSDLGLATANTDDHPLGNLETMLGGFVCTLVSGTLILLVALIAGGLLSFFRSKPESKVTVKANRR